MLVNLFASLLHRRVRALTGSFQRLIDVARDPYRPELHYMRGPGPKWHAKHHGHRGNSAL